jgi:UDP-4-amino-4,6-dideoxy-N-acetyl-beta-L-altrosamine transaminase
MNDDHLPAERFIGYGRQTIEQADVDAVVATLTGDFLTQGPAVPAFEQALAKQAGAKFAVAVSSATAALHIACIAAGMKQGDLGITQPLTFVASANCFAYCGAEIELVDVDPLTLMMSPARLEEVLERRPDAKVIIPVSFSGLSSHGEELRGVAGPDRVLIEDASHAFGADDENGRKVGAGGWADMTVFSFHPVKPITTGEGGAIVTDSLELYSRLKLLRSHGIERSAEKLIAGSADDPWWYEQQTLGYNYRLCDIQAALGLSQIDRIQHFISRRREIAISFDKALAGIPNLKLVLADPAQRGRSGHHLYLVRIDFEAIGKTRAQVMGELKMRGIGTQVHYIPLYKQPYHAPKFPHGMQEFPVTESFYRECLTLPCFPTLSDADIARVAKAVRSVVAGE